MDQLRVISADSHMMEPADLWQERLDRKFRDKAPKVVENPDKPGFVFVPTASSRFRSPAGSAPVGRGKNSRTT